MVLAQSGDGRTLARATIELPAGATSGTAPIVLPPELRNRLSRLVLEGPPTAASVVLLDERWRRRPVGFSPVTWQPRIRRSPGRCITCAARWRRSPKCVRAIRDAAERELSVVILADRPLPAGPEREALAHWVEQGGLLIRFAGPRTAEQPIGETDPLMPVNLLGGDRQLGGALSWAEPAGVAQFPASSPFAGLSVPDEVKVSRQVLAEPSADLANHTWAALADGTPLVTEAARGAGRIVLFHVTANADWSNLPLSGLFVDMLRRLVALSAGVATTADNTVLAPAETLDGYGLLSPRRRPQPGCRPARSPAPSPRRAIPRALWPGKRPAGAEPGRQSAAPGGRPGDPGARIEDLRRRCPSVRWVRRCWRRRCCCWCSIC